VPILHTQLKILTSTQYNLNYPLNMLALQQIIMRRIPARTSRVIRRNELNETPSKIVSQMSKQFHYTSNKTPFARVLRNQLRASNAKSRK
jgi:hypothetical protein